jgi:hypothetical protein
MIPMTQLTISFISRSSTYFLFLNVVLYLFPLCIVAIVVCSTVCAVILSMREVYNGRIDENVAQTALKSSFFLFTTSS